MSGPGLSQMTSIALHANRQSSCWMNDGKEKSPLGDSSSPNSPRKQRCYYVVNFQYPHSKTKTADGRCVTLSRVAIGCFMRLGQSFPAFLLVDGHRACDSFDSSEVASEGTAYQCKRAMGWPMALSVLSRGNVFMFSLADQ